MAIAVHHGDCQEVMKRLKEDGVIVQSCVCDPPYHLSSIVKRFGADNAAPAKSNGASGVYGRASSGFMGQKWDGGDIAFRPETWRLVYDLLPPGGHLLAFSGTRTYHRMVCAIEDAGSEIRDQIGWLYGSGFPKSQDVAKGIDKKLGTVGTAEPRSRPVRRMRPGADQVRSGSWGKLEDRQYEPHEYQPGSEEAAEWQGWGTALKPAWEPIVLARKPLGGTIAETVLKHGTGAINVDLCRVAARGRPLRESHNGKSNGIFGDGLNGSKATGVTDTGRWPANVIHDGSDEVEAAFAEFGESKSVRGSARCGVHGAGWGMRATGAEYDDRGSPSRFFYNAKADANDRWGAKHPTVKPVSLMRWLVRLVTPPNGTVLDPFAGTGTTGAAAIAENFNAILIERDDTFVSDIRTRLDHLNGHGKHSAVQRQRHKEPESAGPLFDDSP